MSHSKSVRELFIFVRFFCKSNISIGPKEPENFQEKLARHSSDSLIHRACCARNLSTRGISAIPASLPWLPFEGQELLSLPTYFGLMTYSGNLIKRLR